ncbi:hypothetical protein ACQP1G_12315 [Nocardia sp. CA-107356]|uniref:hypothetical protein n=1 Tax=Nocardia sp. CA-107356 TaxID=3239972 RepID=UPI003D92D716
MVDLDSTKNGTGPQRTRLDRRMLVRVFSTRPLWGVYVFQYAVNALLWDRP